MTMNKWPSCFRRTGPTDRRPLFSGRISGSERRRGRGWLVVLAALGPSAFAVAATEPQPAPAPEQRVDPQADRILKQMSDYLSAQKDFSYQTESAIEVVTKEGQKVEFNANAKVSVERPAKVR